MAEAPTKLCGEDIERCVEAGKHDPPCRCRGPEGHEQEWHSDSKEAWADEAAKAVNAEAENRVRAGEPMIEVVLLAGSLAPFGERFATGPYRGCEIRISEERAAAWRAYESALAQDVVDTMTELAQLYGRTEEGKR